MPIYEYECRHHGTFERLITEPSIWDYWAYCPECDRFCSRVMSAPSFRVKGHNAANGYSKGDSA